MCDAASNCVATGDSATTYADDIYYSFDLHYLASNATWECVLYFNPNENASYFNVANSDACLSFGYSAPYVQ